MSYDLYLRPRRPFTQETLRGYFTARAHYTIHANKTQVLYANNDTGVYFGFDLFDPATNPNSSADADNPQAAFPVAFNINYFRPHIFGLEAEPEVSAFVRAFNADIFDPQMKGMGSGPYTSAGFLYGYNHGNEFGYSAILGSPNAPAEIFSLPAIQIRMIWNWNFNRDAEQRRRRENIFVPRIMALAAAPTPLTAVVWPKDAPMYMPRTDLIMLHRLETARAGAGEKGDMAFVPWNEIVPMISDYCVPASAPAHFDMCHIPAFTRAFREFFRNAAPNDKDRRIITFDHVLDREAVSRCRPPISLSAASTSTTTPQGPGE